MSIYILRALFHLAVKWVWHSFGLQSQSWHKSLLHRILHRLPRGHSFWEPNPGPPASLVVLHRVCGSPGSADGTRWAFSFQTRWQTAWNLWHSWQPQSRTWESCQAAATLLPVSRDKDLASWLRFGESFETQDAWNKTSVIQQTCVFLWNFLLSEFVKFQTGFSGHLSGLKWVCDANRPQGRITLASSVLLPCECRFWGSSVNCWACWRVVRVSSIWHFKWCKIL